MELTSTAFKNGDIIPAKYTCDGKDINPPLTIEDIPADTKSLVLIMEDPDAPAGLWVHWLVWNISPATSLIPENALPEAVEGTTSWNRIGYGGPCPPDGSHRYFFKIYALDDTLDLPSSTKKESLEKVMENHIIDQAELMGRYERIK